MFLVFAETVHEAATDSKLTCEMEKRDEKWDRRDQPLLLGTLLIGNPYKERGDDTKRH